MENQAVKQNSEQVTKSTATKTEKLSKNGRNINLIISILMATLLWMYVVTAEDTEVSKAFNDIPVTILNEEQLADQKLIIVEGELEGEDVYKVNVRIKAKRSSMNKITKENITATADFSAVTAGDNTIPISINIPETAMLDQAVPTSLKIKVEKIVRVTKPVTVAYQGEANAIGETEVAALEPATVVIEGAESSVSKVEKIVASLDVSKIKEDTVAELSITPQDSSGAFVQGIVMERDKVKADIKLLSVKEVPFKVALKNETDEVNVLIQNAPSTVKIKGTANLLDAISQVESIPVDAAMITEAKQIVVAASLPAGVYLSRENPQLKVDFSPVKMSEKNIVFTAQDVLVKGLSEGFKVSIVDADITATVKAADDKISSITKDMISIVADVNELSEGQYDINLTYEADDGISIVLSPAQISLEIAK